MPTQNDVSWFLMRPAAALSLASLVGYHIYRAHCTVYALPTTTTTTSWINLALESTLLLHWMQKYALRIFISQRPNRIRPPLQGDDVPRVDILITVCKEALAVILDTVRGALHQQYPRGRFRVVVLDDGADEQVREEVALLQRTWPNLYYTSRTKPAKNDYKAGNLNHGLKYTRALAIPPSLTRDHGRRARFSGSPAWRFDEIGDTAVSSATMSATFLLSSSLLNSQRIDPKAAAGDNQSPSALGEFVACLDADMIAEPDWLRKLLPLLLEDPKLALGSPPPDFFNIPVNDPLSQSMLTFSSIAELVGGIQYGLHLRFSLFAPLAWRPKVAGVIWYWTQFNQALISIGYLALPWMLFTDTPIIAYSTKGHFLWQLWLVCLWKMCDIVFAAASSWHSPLEIGTSYDSRITEYDVEMERWLSPYAVAALFWSFLPEILGGKAAGFEPSGSSLDAVQERNPRLRPSRWVRLYTGITAQCMWIHATFILACSWFPAAILLRSVLHASTFDDWATHTLTRIGWPHLIWAQFVKSAFIPLLYMAFSPDAPDRESLLDRDTQTLEAHPKHDFRLPVHRRSRLWKAIDVLVMAWPVILLGWTMV